MAKGGGDIKQLRYRVMLALYLPILLYSFSTFDLKEETVLVKEVKPVLSGGQETVILGQEYTANAYLKASKLSKGGQITLSTDDEKVTVEGNESIRIATAKLLSEGEEKKEVTYEANIQYDRAKGGPTSETLTGSFTVRRPELVATSVATKSLYRRTRNQIRIDVPGLEGRPLQLKSSSGGSVDGRQLTLSPSSNSVTVSAFLPSKDGEPVYLGKKEFAVIDPPRPQLKVLDAKGKQISNGESLPRARPVLEFNVEPDPEFAKSYPKDARYRVRQAKVSIRKGLKASQEIGTFDLGNDSSLKGSLIRGLNKVRAQKKDRLIIQLKDVVRINHAGQAIPVKLNESSLSYSFILA